jgi:hypothetical protein
VTIPATRTETNVGLESISLLLSSMNAAGRSDGAGLRRRFKARDRMEGFQHDARPINELAGRRGCPQEMGKAIL